MLTRALVVLTWLVGSCQLQSLAAQVVGPDWGSLDAPTVVIDESSLPWWPAVQFPPEPWAEARACLARQGVVVWGRDTLPPALMVIPGAGALLVHDLTVDSLIGRREIQGPLVAYALMRTDVALVVERYRRHLAVLRHEALHFMLWRSRRLSGHPARYFFACDQAYDLFNPPRPILPAGS